MFQYSVCASEGAALHEPVLFRGSYPDAFAYAKSFGFTGIEIHLRDASCIDHDALRRSSEETGVRIAAIATGLAKRIDGLSLISDDPEMRKTAVERIKGHLDLAAEYGCPVVIGSMRDNIPSPALREQSLTRLEEAMRACLDYISGKSCSIVFEAINRYENNYFNTAAETLDFVDRIGSPQLKVLLDTFHMNIEEQNMADAIRLLGDKLGHIHFADNTRHYPGHGTIDYASVLRALRQIDYRGLVSMEYLPLPDEATATRVGFDYIRALEQAVAME